MADLQVKYLGMDLKNPVIVSSSGLTSDVKNIREMETAGAAAVVLKSLFEEQILFEAGHLLVGADYPEAGDYMLNYLRHRSVDEYLTLIEESKKTTSIPIIASINCISNSEWIDFASRIENAGADALELNVFFLPNNPEKTAADYEQLYYDLAESVKSKINIPLVFKLGRQFTNLTGLVNQLSYRKVDGVVLFNRFFEPDIDPEKQRFIPSEVFSHPNEIRQTLRWVGILSGYFEPLEFAASTGVHDSESVIKLLFAGASVVQVCSVLYQKGIPYLRTLIDEMDHWLDKHGYASVKDIHGKMSYRNLPDPSLYERTQFMKYFSDFH